MTLESESGGELHSRKLCILHLEDDLRDREVIRRFLISRGVACDFLYAATEIEFENLVENARFDLIFADFTLPGYDAMAALNFALEKNPEIPWIFVSGTIGEQLAIESFKSGATDYVFKDDLEQLVPAMRRALREAAERLKRKQAEEALRDAEERYRSIFENAVEGIYQSQPDGPFLVVNPSLARILGYASPEELLSASTNGHRDLIAEDRRAEFEAGLSRDGRVLDFESKVRRADGSLIWVSINTRVVRDSAGVVRCYEGSVEDITARKSAEASLRTSEERFREMAENIRDVFWVTSPDTQEILYISPAYESIWGRPAADLIAEPVSWLMAVVEDYRPSVVAALKGLAGGEEYRIEYRIRRPDGTERWVEDRGYPIFNAAGKVERALGCVTDITERKRLEAELRQVQKMESIGQLAGGIAHDFNNVLTVINGHVYLLLDKEHLDPETMQCLREVYAAGEHAARLTRQLLVFSRKQPIQTQVLDLTKIIEETGQMLRRLLGAQITLQISFSTQPALVQADAGMIEQILVNLAVNARDAMREGGKLFIRSELISIPPHGEITGPEARAGEFVCLVVRDTGCGISREVLPRIFEPFFTTKETGEGTGLGLATVYGIVKQHQGWVEVESELGAGTTFKVYLPRFLSEAAEARPKSDDAKIAGGSETILLVEDEAPVRELAAAVLRRLGYRVLQAASGHEALEVWQWHAPRISLLLTDIVMPDDMTGVELAKKLGAERPGLKVIFGSGYSEAVAGQTLPYDIKFHILQKPYHPKALAKAVRDMLDV